MYTCVSTAVLTYEPRRVLQKHEGTRLCLVPAKLQYPYFLIQSHRVQLCLSVNTAHTCRLRLSSTVRRDVVLLIILRF